MNTTLRFERPVYCQIISMIVLVYFPRKIMQSICAYLVLQKRQVSNLIIALVIESLAFEHDLWN